MKYPCGFCNLTTHQTHAVQCVICEFWHHRKCIPGMTDDFFKHLNGLKDGVGSVYWLCGKCEGINKKMKQMMSQITGRVENLEKKEAENRAKGEENETKITKVEARLGKLEDSDKKGASSAEVFKEIGDRKSREDNLVVHGLEEPPESLKDGKERAAADYDKFQEVVNKIGLDVRVKEVVKFGRRTGAKKNDEPRPLILGFKQSEARKEILENAKKLNDEDDPWKKIKIVTDLTKMQRDEEAKMMNDAKEKNEELSEEDKTKNGMYKVVGKRGQRRMIRATEEEDKEKRGVPPRRQSVRKQNQK